MVFRKLLTALRLHPRGVGNQTPPLSAATAPGASGDPLPADADPPVPVPHNTERPMERVVEKPAPPPSRGSERRKPTASGNGDREKNPSRKRIQRDKKGVRILYDTDDLAALMGVDPPQPPVNEFSRLLERSWKDAGQKRMHSEKAVEKPPPAPRPLKEQLKLRPGPQAELDLHGRRSSEAEEQAERFINGARAEGLLTVRIIVGKGLHSEGDPVLPSIVEKKLIDLKREGKVMAVQWDKKEKHKSGSLIVYLVSGGTRFS